MGSNLQYIFYPNICLNMSVCYSIEKSSIVTIHTIN